MPTYEYRCGACGHEFEAFQSMKDAALKKCPACAKNSLVRLIGTGAAIVFKGSGFYQTDYRSESYKKSAEAERGEKPSGESSAKNETKAGESGPKPESASASNAKADTRPDAKPLSKPDSGSKSGSKSASKSRGASGGPSGSGGKSARGGGGS